MYKKLILIFLIKFFCISFLSGQFSITPSIGLTSSNIHDFEQKNCSFYDEQFGQIKWNYEVTFRKSIFDRAYLGLSLGYLEGETKGGFSCILHYDVDYMNYNFILFEPQIEYRISHFILSTGLPIMLLIDGEERFYNGYGFSILKLKEIVPKRNFNYNIGLGYAFYHFILQVDYSIGLQDFFHKDRIEWLRVGLGYEYIF